MHVFREVTTSTVASGENLNASHCRSIVYYILSFFFECPVEHMSSVHNHDFCRTYDMWHYKKKKKCRRSFRAHVQVIINNGKKMVNEWQRKQ